MLAAIEIYNKPQITYRAECSTILLVNAWELLLKALLSKNKQRIFYPKQKGQPYKTISLQDAIDQAKPFFPASVPFEPTAQNLHMLITYRNNVIHFYNQPGLDVVIYGLAQTCIVNYKDVMLSIFNHDISNEMSINLLPLSFGVQPDPIQFLQNSKANPPKSKELANFLNEVSNITYDLESRQLDTSRFLAVFKVTFQSVKKVTAADVVVGVQDIPDDASPVVVERRIDPNISHPEQQKSIVKKIGGQLHDMKFTEYTFQAIVWKYDIKNKSHLCWSTDNGMLTRYSSEVISIIKKLSKNEIETAKSEYSEYLRSRRKPYRTKGKR